GVVYLAHDVKLACPVAIKVLPYPEISTATMVGRFKREAQILAQLRHPNIVPVHTVGEADGLPYYVMDYLPAETLATRLLRGPLAHSEVLRLGRDLLSGLGFAHQKGFLHRDIKPSNIFLEEHRAILGDFGISRSSNPGDSTFTEPGGIVGTRGYMSPEQAAGLEVREPSDLYAVGIILYEACSGTRLAELTPPDKIGWSGIPRWLRPILRSALEWEVKDRWPDAPTFKVALNDARSRSRRRRLLTALAVLAVLLVVWPPWPPWPPWPHPGPVPSRADLAILPFATGGGPIDIDGAEFAKLVQGNLEWFGRIKLTPAEYVANLFHARGTTGANPSRALQATFVVKGLLVRRSSDLLLRVTVLDSTAQTRDGFEVAAGSADLLSWSRAVADSAVRRIFPHHLDNYRTLSSAVSPGNSLPAYRHYFAGEQAFQRDAYRTALAQYDSARALDSSFIWSAWRIAIVRRFLRQPFEEYLKQLYLTRGRELPGQYRALIEALLEPDLTRRFARYRQVVNAYPRDGYVRFVYADELFHRGPLAGIPLDSALAQFRETVRIEPYLEQMPSWDHLLYGYMRLGRRAEADSALARRDRIPPSGEDEDRRRRRFFKLAYDYRFQPWLAALKQIGIRIGPDSTLLEGMQRYVRLGLSFDLPEAQMALGRVLVDRGTLPFAKANGHQALGMALLFQGRPMAALPHLDSAAARFGRRDSLLERAEWRVLPGALGLRGVDPTEVR
ncbi:MAG: serine/threonine-protein kinase, partial [Gemmatimonadales bacterium]